MAAMLLLSAVLAAVPFERGVKDWTVACDNGRSCTLKALPDVASQGALTGLVVTVTREPGGAAQPTVEIWAADQQPLDPQFLRLDGRALPTLAWQVDQTEAYDISVEGGDALRLLRLLRDGHSLKRVGGAALEGASLDGAAAALLAMDAAQGREGGVTAVVRPGPAPASSVPPTPALPVIVASPPPPPLSDPKALVVAVRRATAAELEKSGCDEPGKVNDEDSADALTATDAVVILHCSAGAYQSNALAFRVTVALPSQAQPLVLPLIPGEAEGEAVGDPIINPGFSAEEASFTSWAKGRALGDCGVSKTWTWDGHEFRLSALSRQIRCGGQEGDWQNVWRTDVRRPWREGL